MFLEQFALLRIKDSSYLLWKQHSAQVLTQSGKVQMNKSILTLKGVRLLLILLQLRIKFSFLSPQIGPILTVSITVLLALSTLITQILLSIEIINLLIILQNITTSYAIFFILYVLQESFTEFNHYIQFDTKKWLPYNANLNSSQDLNIY